jgi:hypothetical protein
VGLRTTVLFVLGIGAVLGVVLAITHCPQPWLVMTLYSALGIIAILIERGRYRPALSGSHFVPTDERFRDPVSGQALQVYVDQATGQRDYRPANDA